jgi:hypothetical protein
MMFEASEIASGIEIEGENHFAGIETMVLLC